MSSDKDIGSIVKSVIQVKIMEALNSAPELVEKLAIAAIHEPVDSNGRTGQYDSKIPYMDYLLKSEIRIASQKAIRKILKEREPELEEIIRKELSSIEMVDAVKKTILKTVDSEYKIIVRFKGENDN